MQNFGRENFDDFNMYSSKFVRLFHRQSFTLYGTNIILMKYTAVIIMLNKTPRMHKVKANQKQQLYDYSYVVTWDLKV